MQPVDVLLVEDSPYDAEMTLATFRELRLANRIEWVKDGITALDYLFRRGEYSGRERTNPRLVLLDLKLPGMDGLEVLSVMKSDENLRQIPVVMLTSSAEESDMVRGYNLGINSYVVKPVDFEQFTSEVAKLGFYWMLLNRLPRQAGGDTP